MSAADWAALRTDFKFAGFVIGCLIAAAVIYLACCLVRLAWQRLVAFHRAGMARVERLADPTPLPGEFGRYDDTPCHPQRPCAVKFDSRGDRGLARICDWHKLGGRHRADLPVHVITDAQDRWSR